MKTRKINIFVASIGPRGRYFQFACSTDGSKTCKDAKETFIRAYPQFTLTDVKAYFDVPSKQYARGVRL